jgi:hypothetical protein
MRSLDVKRPQQPSRCPSPPSQTTPSSHFHRLTHPFPDSRASAPPGLCTAAQCLYPFSLYSLRCFSASLLRILPPRQPFFRKDLNCSVHRLVLLSCLLFRLSLIPFHFYSTHSSLFLYKYLPSRLRVSLRLRSHHRSTSAFSRSRRFPLRPRPLFTPSSAAWWLDIRPEHFAALASIPPFLPCTSSSSLVLVRARTVGRPATSEPESI